MKPNMAIIGRPEADEYAPYYDKVCFAGSTDDILVTLEKQPPETGGSYCLLAKKRMETSAMLRESGA